LQQTFVSDASPRAVRQRVADIFLRTKLPIENPEPLFQACSRQTRASSTL
jgi:hypothetical protein